jgi:hypothetical protein
MRIEKVTSPLAEGWEYVRRITARQYSDYLQATKESESVGSAIRFVALCTCNGTGESPWATTEQAIAAVGGWDWQLVRDIDKQACAFNGFKTVEDAEKNS